MKLVPAELRTRTIHPLPEVDPDFSVTVRKLSSVESGRIYDRHGWNPNKPSAVKLEKILRDQCVAAVQRVDGATDSAGDPLDPEAKETKLLLMDVELEDPDTGKKVTLWDRVAALYAEAEAETEKK